MLGRLRPVSYRGLRRSLERYLKYQVVTKLVTLAVVAPIMALATAFLVSADGQSVVTQATLVPFLLSWRGAGFAAVLAVVLVAGFVLEVNGFITISSRAVHHAPEAQYRHILRHGLLRARNLVGLALPVLLIYMVVIVPLTGAGTTISGLTGVAIPNFIMEVINGSTGYFVGYVLLLAVLATCGVLLSFTFHFVVLANERITQAMGHSISLIGRHWRRYMRFVVEASVGATVIFLVAALWLLGVFGLLSTVGVDSAWKRMLFMALWLIQQSALGLAALLVAPIQVHALTRTFYDCVEGDHKYSHLEGRFPDLRAKTAPSILDRLLGRRWGIVGLWLATIVALAIPGGLLADVFLRNPDRIEVIGHRAGGYGTPENSLSGLALAVSNGVWGVEVDVQRTSDGVYVLNHDETFRRAAGERRSAAQMTAAEVAELDIDRRPDVVERVPTLEEFLLAAKGHATVLIELKGATADAQMAADITAMVRRLDMGEEAILISLNYGLIRQIEETDPATETGYLYFWALGSVDRLDGDYLILEEGEASNARLIEIANANKRAIVWTVNDAGSMQRFAGKPVFGLITDEIVQLDAVLRQRGSGTDRDLFLQLFLGPVF